MKLSEIGEFEFIRRLAPRFSQNLPKNVEGIGDDCAILPYKDGLSLLVTTDLLNENIHFIRDKINPGDLGYKSLAVNLSDIAAMGGSPLYAFLSLGLPSDLNLEWCEGFLEGFHQLAKQEKVLLLGGDTTRSINDIIINVVIIGEIETTKIKRRSTAKPGDLICCTGYLGSSGAGLKALLDRLPLDNETLPLLREHLRPRPHLEEGRWLASQKSVHAMMDVSDGIDSDIQRIMEQSGCGAIIHLDRLPISQSLLHVAETYGWNVLELAAASGEDYCLLLTVDRDGYEQLNQRYSKQFTTSLFQIGEVTATSSLQYLYHSKPTVLPKSGFDHFKKKLAH